jgi:hypothetical protein
MHLLFLYFSRTSDFSYVLTDKIWGLEAGVRLYFQSPRQIRPAGAMVEIVLDSAAKCRVRARSRVVQYLVVTDTLRILVFWPVTLLDWAAGS